MMTKTLYLLDAHALCYRSFYAVKGLVNSKGQPTNAVFGFVNALRKMMKDFSPEYFAVCFDKDGKGFRQERYAAYKIQRPAMPDDLRSQMGLIRSVVDGYRLGVMEIGGYEADDLIAMAAKTFSGQGIDVVIISDDKDLFQLVGDRVKVYSPRREEMLDDDGVERALGIRPEYVADFLGLAGDSSDNIPGVQGIGKVTAQKLIQQFGSLEKIYDSLEEIFSKSVRDKLAAQRDQAFLSRELVRLRVDAPLSTVLDDWQVKEADTERLFDLFTELEFHKFVSELKPSSDSSGEDFVPVISAWKSVEKSIFQKKQMSFLLSEDGTLHVSDGVATACGKIGGHDGIRQLFDNRDILKITYDVKRQYKMLWDHGLDFRENIFDVMLAGYLLNSSRNGHELAVLYRQYLNQMRAEDADAVQDAAAIFLLYTPLHDEMTAQGSGPLFYDIELPLARVLAQMEKTGVRIDLPLLDQLSGECLKKMEALERDIYTLAGESFNINSPKQLSHILFEKLKLPVVKKIKTGFSTNEEVLHKLASKHKLPEKILDYRQLAKLKSTYIDALPALALQQADGSGPKNVIYTSFNQTVTETGRLSSSNPNLQNIPIRTDLGKQIRRAFVASQDDHLLLSADYSQIELRVLAHLSEDEHLIQAFHADEDIHTFTAGLIFDVKPKDVLPDMRNAAKRVNFGIIYGMSAFGLAKDLNVSNAQAQDFIERYFFRYPRVKAFMDQAIDDCRQKGYAVTLMNRRRDIPEIHSKNVAIRQFAERQAINTPVQGSAADLIKLAMVKIQRCLEAQGLMSRMLITVHDEIVFDLVPAEEKVLIKMVAAEMEGAMALKVPIRVSLKKGKNWMEMEKIV
jgi:DNA polymerase-1